MPYMSNVPDIQCHELVKGDMLVFASDGLRDSMPRLTCHVPVYESSFWTPFSSGQSACQYGVVHNRTAVLFQLRELRLVLSKLVNTISEYIPIFAVGTAKCNLRHTVKETCCCGS